MMFKQTIRNLVAANNAQEKSLSGQPKEILNVINAFLGPNDSVNLGSSSKQLYRFFQNGQREFLKCVALGKQDKVERLFREVYQGDIAKIQEALRYQGRFTDYSARTFNCSAYEYAYWAKDTHMCRMLERYMNEDTKAIIAARIDANTENGLIYQQNDQEHKSPHFDFTPLKEAYQRYLDGFDEWHILGNWAAMKAAWIFVSKAQRDVPVHVIQEYCRPDRSFYPCPSFNESTLPRVLTFYNWNTHSDESLFPLTSSNSGLGFDFGLWRQSLPQAASFAGVESPWESCWLWLDLAAITRLDEVRTAELTQLREQLNPQAPWNCMIM